MYENPPPQGVSVRVRPRAPLFSEEPHISGCAAFLRSTREASLRAATPTPNKRRQLEKQRRAEELRRAADEVDQKAAEHEKSREIEFYAAALDGYYTTSFEYDKGIFTLAAGGLGLLVTLLTTSTLKTLPELFGYLGGITAFSVDLLLLLWIFRLNKDHILHVVLEQEELSSKKLKRVDFAVVCFFVIGVAFTGFVGVSAGMDSYEKVKGTADNKANPPATPIVRRNSTNGVKRSRPDASQASAANANKSVVARANNSGLASIPQNSVASVAKSSSPASSAPAAPASSPVSNPTGKGR